MKSRSLACTWALFALMALGVSCKGSGNDAGTFIQIVITDPEDEETEVPVEARIGVRIDAPIDAASLTDATFFLTDDQGMIVPSTIFIGDEPDIAELDPIDALPVISTFTATVTTGLRAAGGATLEEDYEWTFTTLDSAWGASQWLEEIGAGSSSAPQIAVDAELNALTVWQYEDAAGTSIFASRYTRADLWGTPVAIDSGAGGSSKPKLAVDDAGNGFAVWEQREEGAAISRVWTSRYAVDDGAWSAPELLQSDQITTARSPSIAADAAGNAIAVWLLLDTDTGNIVMRANRYTLGAGWGSPESIDESPTPRAGTSTAVGMDGDGNAIAVWSRPTVAGTAIWANRYAAGSTWGTAQAIKPDTITGVEGVRLAVGQSGDAFVTWAQSDGARDDIWGIRFSGSSWETPERLDTYEDGNKQQPDIAVGGSGVAHAVWSQADLDFENIWAAQYTPSSGWGAPEPIEPPNEDPTRDGNATHPRVAANAAGNTFVVWRQPWAGWGSIWSNRLDPDSGWMTAELIEERDRAAGLPIIAVDQARHAHAVWPHSEARDIDWVRTNRFE